MTLPAESLKLLTTLDEIGRESIPFDNKNLVDPSFANTAVDGEWFQINEDRELVRFVNDVAHVDAGAENAGLVKSYLLIEQVGTTDKQASGKGTVTLYHQFLAKSKIYAAAGLFVGCQLEVHDMAYDGQTRRGLRLLATADAVAVATLTNYDATNGWIEFSVI